MRHNYHIRRAEIDLITLFEGTLHFIEVKAYRSDDYFGPAAFARQIRGYKRALQFFLLELEEAVRQGEEPYSTLFQSLDPASLDLSVDFCGLDATYRVDYYPNIAAGVIRP